MNISIYLSNHGPLQAFESGQLITECLVRHKHEIESTEQDRNRLIPLRGLVRYHFDWLCCAMFSEWPVPDMIYPRQCLPLCFQLPCITEHLIGALSRQGHISCDGNHDSYANWSCSVPICARANWWFDCPVNRFRRPTIATNCCLIHSPHSLDKCSSSPKSSRDKSFYNPSTVYIKTNYISHLFNVNQLLYTMKF